MLIFQETFASSISNFYFKLYLVLKKYIKILCNTIVLVSPSQIIAYTLLNVLKCYRCEITNDKLFLNCDFFPVIISIHITRLQNNAALVRKLSEEYQMVSVIALPKSKMTSPEAS